MSILVTGAAGYIGSALSYTLASEGFDVVGIDNLFRGDYRYLEMRGVPDKLVLYSGDIRDGRFLEKLFSGFKFDIVVHLAAIPGIELCSMYPDDAISSNIYGTYNLLEYSGKFGVKKFIFASSAAVYGIPKETPIREDTSLFPINLYGVTKLAGENLVKIYCEEYGLDGVCLRFGNVYGLGIYTHWKTVIPKFVRLALLGRPLTIYGDGNQTRDFIHVRDINSAIKLFIDLDRNFNGDVYNISTGKAISINRVADIVSDVVREMFDKDVERIYLPPREGEPNIENFCLSNNKVCGLGFRPSSSIREGIIEIIDFYNSFGGVSLDE